MGEEPGGGVPQDDDGPDDRSVDDEIEPADQGLLEMVPAAALRKASIDEADKPIRERANRRRRWLGQRPEPTPAYRGPVEKPEENKTGICCSGGGIRSAAFNLGVLQSLQQHDELRHATYLAAVSGGSYIAAAYSMVADGLSDGRPKGENVDADAAPPEQMPPFARGSPEEQYLRNRSSYLVPDGMAWVYLVLRLLLGLLVNVAFVAVPIGVVMIVTGVFVYPHVLPDLSGGCKGPGCGFHPPSALWVIPAAIAALGLALGFVSVLFRPPNDDWRRFYETWLVRLVLVAGFVALLTLVLPALVGLLQHDNSGAQTGDAGKKAAVVGASGFGGLVAGVMGYLRAAASALKPAKGAGAKSGQNGGGKGGRMLNRIAMAVAYLAGSVAGPLLLLSVATLTLTWALDDHAKHKQLLLLVAGGAALAFALLYFFADLTSWSLHPFYKRRLCTAFALKRVRPDALDPPRRDAGIPQDREQGVAVERDYKDLVTLSDTALAEWPTLIVCAAANISDVGATPPGRHVTSFTFSAHAIGGPLVGALPTDEYEAAFEGRERRKRDFTLPAAVAMAGAALAPSMGKSTRPAFRFLLTLANIRLGVWVPNPRWVARTGRGGDGHLKRFGPRPSYLVREFLGRNHVDAPYLYVSDGGHYENLALVELLRRGCTRIFCMDASGGETFKELGDAVALARSELGVEVELDPTPMIPVAPKGGGPPIAKQDSVIGTVRFPPTPDGQEGMTGTIVYARNVVSPREPWDVRAHQLEDPRFPHDSTLDQLYTDQKFESYRRLGAEAGLHAVMRMAVASPLVPPDPPPPPVPPLDPS